MSFYNFQLKVINFEVRIISNKGKNMFDFLTKLFRDPKSIFIIGFLTKWYMIIVIPAVAAAFFFIKGLYSSGFMQKFEDFVSNTLWELVKVVRDCTPKILDLAEFMSCFFN